ncbi:MAG: phosphomannomutase/phosphoglucomutase [Candidatus Sulfopaludibacter sp.]|nr:phosphomannomutase/phosphoglucomutase [Candidatus Sulfopaludibacter sp.]
MLKSTIFREYDIRGVADVELLSGDIEVLGQAFGSYLRRNAGRKINLARDTRLSSQRLRDALLRGLRASGCDVTDLGVVPTPVLYYSVFHLKADGGVMITGSHNPPEFNGFKTVCGESTIHGEAIQELYRMIRTGDLDRGEGSEKSYDAVTPYVNEVASQFHFPRRIRVVVDAGNGTGGPVMHRILERLNADATEMFFEMDGRFPNHHPDPTVPKNLEALIAKVRETHADMGIAFDGDTDRIGAIDDHGAVIYGDQLMIIYGREILTRKPGATFIGEVKCSQLMYDDLAAHGGNPIMWKTGHSLIKAKMKETKAELAGEMSGHMFFADRYYGFDDALYAACRLMEIVANSGRPLSAQLEDLPRTVTTPEIRFDCPDELKFQVVKLAAAELQSRHKTLDVDGVRVLFPQGWGLVRASNTQPVLVMRFEATTEDLLRQYREEVEAVVKSAVARAAGVQPIAGKV